MLKLSNQDNENYSARIVKITNLNKIEKADRLQRTNIYGNSVITDLSAKIDDLYVYFPSGSQLSEDFCKNNNLYRDTTKNKDNTKSGLFDENRRVKTINLLGEKSNGFIIPIECLDIEFPEKYIDIAFDTFNGDNICKKYIVKKKVNSPRLGGQVKKVKESKILEDQFRFHIKTPLLGVNINSLNPDDIISITYKIHGTSSISSKVLCKKKLTVFEKFLKKLKVCIVDKQYDNIYASRTVIKNAEITPNATHFYGFDIWQVADKELRKFLTDGLTIYYEIAGYSINEACIQKDYDYGYKRPEYADDFHFNKNFGIFIYRITYTNPSGLVYELSARQVQNWCKERNLQAVPELYYGTCKDLFPELNISEHWHTNFLEKLILKYNNKKCFLCKNKVPEEGIVIRNESRNDLYVYKLKSFEFLKKESKEQDLGIENIEDNECSN